MGILFGSPSASGEAAAASLRLKLTTRGKDPGKKGYLFANSLERLAADPAYQRPTDTFCNRLDPMEHP